MAMNLTTTNGLINLARVFYESRMLKSVRDNLVFYQLCDTDVGRIVPEMHGPSIQWTRLVNLDEGKTLTQGTTPTSTSLSTEIVTASLVQKGDIVTISDLLKGQTLLKKIENVAANLGYGAARTIDGIVERACTLGNLRENEPGLAMSAVLSDYHISTIVKSGYAIDAANTTLPYISFSGSEPVAPLANTEFGNYSEVAASFTNSNMAINIGKLQAAVTYLKTRNAAPWPDGFFRAVMHPKMVQLIMRDPEFQTWAQYGNAPGMGYMNSEVGAVARIRILESNRARVFGTMFSASALFSGFVTTIVGVGAVTCVNHADKELGSSGDSASKGIELIIKLPSMYDKYDALNQWTSLGYKMYTAAKVLDTYRGVNLLQFYSSSTNRK